MVCTTKASQKLHALARASPYMPEEKIGTVMSPGGGVLDQILEGDVPSRFRAEANGGLGGRSAPQQTICRKILLSCRNFCVLNN